MTTEPKMPPMNELVDALKDEKVIEQARKYRWLRANLTRLVIHSALTSPTSFVRQIEVMDGWRPPDEDSVDRAIERAMAQ